MSHSTKNDRIELAVDALGRQRAPNVAAVAREFGICRSTLWARFRGKSVSRAQANSEHRQRLNNVQEDTLLRYIDTLSDRFIPPTP